MRPLADLLICLRFFSRLPVPSTARERNLGANGFVAAAAMSPVAGVIVAALPALVLCAARGCALPAAVRAVLALAALAAVTGALHEDALADCADGLGGRGRQRKLDIMRDSRIGAFGATALVFSVLLRAVALTAAVDQGRGVVAVFLSACLSRTACLLPLAILPPARSDGLGASAARPVASAVIGAGALAVVIVALWLPFGLGAGRASAAILAAASLSLLTCVLAHWQIGGQTGDVAGAAQQLAEIAVLIVFSAA